MPDNGARKVVKPIAAAVVTIGTMASIWWFALKPRRKVRAGTETIPGDTETGQADTGETETGT
jgi:hypothetical protein